MPAKLSPVQIEVLRAIREGQPVPPRLATTTRRLARLGLIRRRSRLERWRPTAKAGAAIDLLEDERA